MITLEKAKEIFSDKECFKIVSTKNIKGKLVQRVQCQFQSKEGKWHYDFTIKETSYNQCATIDFSKWHRMCAKVCCFDICDEGFLLTIIDMCKQGLA